MTIWNQRLAASTRGRILALLQRSHRTTGELAQILHLTENAVRAQLKRLEREGLVQQVGTRQSARKPNLEYGLTPETEHLFTNACGPVFNRLLGVLETRMLPEALEEILREVGHQMAAENSEPLARQDINSRIERARELLQDLGGVVEMEEQEGRVILRGYRCPLSVIVSGRQQVCRLVETMLTDIIGVPVHERCERGVPPHCLFEISAGR